MSVSEELVRDALNAFLNGKPYGAVTEFCKKTGIKKHNLQRYRKPGSSMPLEALDQAAKGLGCQAWELVKPDNAENTVTDPSIREALAILGNLHEPQRREALAWLRGFARGAQAEQEALSKRGDTG